MIGSTLPQATYTRKNIDRLPQWNQLPKSVRQSILLASVVFPFKVNRYVADRLIDWRNATHDPIFRLTFPTASMLTEKARKKLEAAISSGKTRKDLATTVSALHHSMNPHPGGQMELNVPRSGDVELAGAQHKYKDTVLYFPSQGQTCHAYCTYCFRWAQFVGDPKLKIAGTSPEQLEAYLQAHPEVSDVLITGGDPMIMKASALDRILQVISRVHTVRTIRIGTKVLSYWPYRVLSDPDSESLLNVLRTVSSVGKQLAFMAHVTHPQEITAEFRLALKAVQDTGAVVRCQSPIVNHVNASASCWASLWQQLTELGVIPYYMFVERDTGARHYFQLDLLQCWSTFSDAKRRVGGLARSARGPVMSAVAGKIEVLSAERRADEIRYQLRYVRARNEANVGPIFSAISSGPAYWVTDLQPLTDSDKYYLSAL